MSQSNSSVIVIDTCAYCRLINIIDNLFDLEFVYKGIHYVIKVHDGVDYEIQQSSKIKQKYKKYPKTVSQITRRRVLKPKSSQINDYHDAMNSIEFIANSLFNFQPPVSTWDINCLALSRIKNNLIVVTDDLNMTTLGKYWKIQIIDSLDFIFILIDIGFKDSGILEKYHNYLENIKDWIKPKFDVKIKSWEDKQKELSDII